MNKGLRLSEKWFRFGLWLVALVFAGFLIGLGGTVVDNLPRVERTHQIDEFIDAESAEPLRQVITKSSADLRVLDETYRQAELRHAQARATTMAAQQTFSNWLATRDVTRRTDQDAEVIRRTAKLDELKEEEQKALQELQQLRQRRLSLEQAERGAQRELDGLRESARHKLEQVARQQELRVFLYRLALTLPLLGVAGWLFVRKRQSMYWPFVWGFILFALFAFFVELVPYLPSYGGFVRYLVGIVVTIVVGRQAILGLTRYLERQKQAEALPDVERRKELSYDIALTRLGRKACPGCERAVNLDDAATDYCPHCGICLYNRCEGCSTRKNAFSRFCFSCGRQAAGIA
ncbi:serine endopeptidase [Herbaspirillum seropedicae]|uniref:serine endopeptidase n=1 Tax=Herbaspirillum seropedicae TaxID=964 RepID=UPI0028639D63|nr:serine endopeptidase [Herbaspirillum seropedicae]MDR6394489.1 putative RNA-binding Zn-ribbon protein involved in translation (DUF1610 family) [Herbaspirillum seropedicae]